MGAIPNAHRIAICTVTGKLATALLKDERKQPLEETRAENLIVQVCAYEVEWRNIDKPGIAATDALRLIALIQS